MLTKIDGPVEELRPWSLTLACILEASQNNETNLLEVHSES